MNLYKNNAKTKNDFVCVKAFFENNGLTFPTSQFGEWLENLETKTCKKYNLLNDQRINSNRISSLEEYLAKYSNSCQSDFRLVQSALDSILEACNFWNRECHSSYSREQLAIIMLARVLKIHCSVLYKNDIVPDSDTVIAKTIVTHDKMHFSVLFKR